MPRDFKTFVKNNKNSEEILNNNKEKVDEYAEIINKYKDMDQQDLMRNLIMEAGKLKQAGKLTDESLVNLKSTLSPFLNKEQNEMLDNLIKAIKD